MSTVLPQLSLDRATTDRSSADSFELGSARRHGGRTLRPVLHNSRADVTAAGSNAQVRCFFSLAHKRCNPYESDFHMQARLGFKRPNRAAQIRLRPIDHASAQPESGGQFQPAPPSQQKNTLESPSPAYRRRRRNGRKQPGDLSLSPPPPAARSASPVMESSSRPITALVPEQGNVTWTTFEGMTRDTVGAVLSEAMRVEEPPAMAADGPHQVPLMEAAVAAADADAAVSPGSADVQASAAPPAAEARVVRPAVDKDVATAPPAAKLPDVPAAPPAAKLPDVATQSKTPLLEAAPSAASSAQVVVKRVLTHAYQSAQYLGFDAAHRGGAWRHLASVGTWASLAPHGVGGSRW